MAHFAKLDANNIVTQVIVVDNDEVKDGNGDEVESIGVAFCQKIFGADTTWKQTSYNNNLRGNYAGIGATYMTNVATMGVGSTDIFIHQQPYPSWSIGVGTAQWYAPIDGPPDLTVSEQNARKSYTWDEDAYNADSGSPKTIGWVFTDA